jgi:hypothetical protein
MAECEKCLEEAVDDLLRGWSATDMGSVVTWTKCRNCGDENINITLDPSASRTLTVHHRPALDIDGIPVAASGGGTNQ